MFKLIFGLGNLDIENVKALAKLYAEAGAWMFVVSPFMLNTLNESIIECGLNPDDFKFCVSNPLEADKHGKKAKIIENKCKKCSKCEKSCPQNAIINFVCDENKCIGCSKCKKVCPHNAIELYDKKDYFEAFKEILKAPCKIDCVELHASVPHKSRILKKLKKICKKYKGAISLCISRKVFSLNDSLLLIQKAREIAKDNADFFVQADGNSMNCANSQPVSTLECVAFAAALKDSGFDEKKIILSGGVNEFTKDLCHKFSLHPKALAFGTYARKSVQNLSYDEALRSAKNLVLNACEACHG